MAAVPEGLDVLVRFARLVSDAGAPSEILEALAEALTKEGHADGVAVVSLERDGSARLASHRNLPVTELAFDADEIMPGLGRQIMDATGTTFAAERTTPLVSAGSLFGAVAMLFTKEVAVETAALSDALVDLAAVALGNAAQLGDLERSHDALRESQDVLARTEKLRALGQMAAGVSHDMKNILNPLSLHLQLLDRMCRKGDTEGAKESIAEMKQVVTRGVQILERLRDYSRQTKETRAELVDLDNLAREALSIAKSRMASGGKAFFMKEELTQPAPVMAVSGEVVSALVNLIVNAIDAMTATKGTTITLRSGGGGGKSWIEICDDGPGMDKATERRVFEPFFTTKGTDGTGLGLAMVYACMQRHGGDVKIDTAVGRGTTFRLTFPDANAPSSMR